jgi:hypothetical protein
MDKRVRATLRRRNPYNLTNVMPVLSHELLLTAVELVCYFCTTIGVVFAFLFTVRA